MKNVTTQTVSVIMPVYNQANFIVRAIESLKQQSLKHWELLIVNDGSNDNLQDVISDYLGDSRIRYFENNTNCGLGFCLNRALSYANSPLIAYLPADDVYYKEHLQELAAELEQDPSAILAYSGVRHHYNRSAAGVIDGYPLQLVQVMHKKSSDRWMEREELVTDDLGRMFWNKLAKRGTFAATGKITCEWVDHPHQRHKILQEPVGGINPYKLYYKVSQPLRYHTTVGNYIDEVNYFKPFRERPDTPLSSKGLKIVLLGELAYNSERVLALEEQGHKLYGLWMKDPYWYNSVGPLPFGHVEDIPSDNWRKRLEEIQPDVIYGLLNWQAVPFAHEVLMNNPGIPFVWHFKEGPFICLEKGTWNQLIDLYTKSDGQIYSSPEMRDWFLQFVPGSEDSTLVLDGDLPKKEWFKTKTSGRLSELDGQIHTVVPGRPIGLHPHTVAELAKEKIHLHFYGDFTHGQWKQWIDKTQSMAPGYLHIHSNVTQESWVKEFSQYDAGWLHFFKSENYGELMRANWDDLNYPARMATLAVAGLPMLQRDNTGHIVATQTLVKDHQLGLFFNSIEELGEQLRDKQKLEQIRKNVWDKRLAFSFDYHVNSLTSFFRKIIDRKQALLSEKASA
ncbi:glycosyltransferase family 2 protein [Pedobacter sp. SYSU D00535]|uniref:glycosyltransferase family 2 protein n=1 Tax=Pedobacter sp. SYSU D00535 TaxID=2810308 RepID=UPI001A97B66A|nr:glycosyltransferase family 2 protein [Pedobacter sp. SYSU D00535]